MRFTSTVLAIASVSSFALGVSADGSLAQVGNLLTRDFETRLNRRQGSSDGISALQQLGQAVSSGGSKCNTECSSWKASITTCTTGGTSSAANIGRCACQTDTLSGMQTCATCFDLTSAYTSFSNLCQSVLSSSNSSSASAGSSPTSDLGSASATPASATSEASAATSATTEAAMTTTEAAMMTTTASAAAAATTTARASGAGKQVVLGAGVGFLGLAVAFMA